MARADARSALYPQGYRRIGRRDNKAPWMALKLERPAPCARSPALARRRPQTPAVCLTYKTHSESNSWPQCNNRRGRIVLCTTSLAPPVFFPRAVHGGGGVFGSARVGLALGRQEAQSRAFMVVLDPPAANKCGCVVYGFLPVGWYSSNYPN